MLAPCTRVRLRSLRGGTRVGSPPPSSVIGPAGECVFFVTQDGLVGRREKPRTTANKQPIYLRGELILAHSRGPRVRVHASARPPSTRLPGVSPRVLAGRARTKHQAACAVPSVCRSARRLRLFGCPVAQRRTDLYPRVPPALRAASATCTYGRLRPPTRKRTSQLATQSPRSASSTHRTRRPRLC